MKKSKRRPLLGGSSGMPRLKDVEGEDGDVGMERKNQTGHKFKCPFSLLYYL